MGVINQKLSVIKEAQVFCFSFQPCRALETQAVLNLFFRIRTGGSLEKLANTAYGLMGALMQRKEIAYRLHYFQHQAILSICLNIDDARAKTIGNFDQ